MTAYDKATADRLCREAREDDERMTPGPWRCARIADDYGRIDGPGWPVAQVLHDYDERPLIDEDTAAHADGDINGIARTRNNLAALADQLEAAGRTVDSGNKAFLTCREHWKRERCQLTTERDALLARLLEIVDVLGTENDEHGSILRAISDLKSIEVAKIDADIDRERIAQLNALNSILTGVLNEDPDRYLRKGGDVGILKEILCERDALRAHVLRLTGELEEALALRGALIASDVGNRSRIREIERQRDDHRSTLNRFADRLRVVHEDPKIAAAVDAALDERDELRAEVRRLKAASK